MAQESTPNNATAVEVANAGSSKAVSLPLLVGLPVLLVVITLVVLLLLFLIWYNYRSRRKDQAAATTAYQKVPTHDIGPVVNLPYPTRSLPAGKPKIEMLDPPVPGTTTQFVEQAGGYPRSRYPFTEDTDGDQKEKATRKPRRALSRRAKPLDVRFRSSDRSSDGSEEGYGSPRLPSSPGSRSAAVTPPPSPVSTHVAEETKEKYPELFLSLMYHQNESLLVVTVERTSGLPHRSEGVPVDAYVRLFFIPKLAELPQRRTTKTRTKRRDSSPVFNEVVEYSAMSAEELINSALHIEVLDYRSYGKDVVLGQADLPLIQVQFVRGEASIVLPLKLPKSRENLGTVLVSICYSPDTKKLGVIILRAKDLNNGNSKQTDAQAKIWVTLGGDKILGRMRTKKKAQSCSPIFNEALTCTVEPPQVKLAAVNITMVNDNRQASKRELGQVILCGQCSGEEFRHWNDVMATPGKHIAEWHELR